MIGNILPDNGVEVDGETYYGIDAARFEYDWVTQYEDYGVSDLSITVMPATYKVVKYQASTGTIVTEEHNITSSVTYTSSTSTSYYYVYSVYLTIPKTADDLILWIETEFPEE